MKDLIKQIIKEYTETLNETKYRYIFNNQTLK